MKTAIPLRTIALSTGTGGNYYDAAATSREQDYGAIAVYSTEDYYFASQTRWIALGRLRKETRNNPYLAGLVTKYPEAIGRSTLRSRTRSREYNLAKDALWRELALRITTAGDSLHDVEDLLKQEMLLAGELFIVKLQNGLTQLIPSEFCGSTAGLATLRPDGGRELNGLIYDASGALTHYRFGTVDPTGFVRFTETGSTLVPAGQVIHVFRRDRVLQGRGLPWLLPCLRPAHDLYEITRAKTKQIKDITSIFGTIEKLGAEKFLQGLSLAPETGIDGTPTPESPNAPADKKPDEPVKIELKNGTFIALEPGEKLNLLSSKYEAADYQELVMLMLHAISSPVGLPVELWFSGLGDVNYSGFKGLGVQWSARRRDLHDFFEAKFLTPLHDWLMEYARLAGRILAAPTPTGPATAAPIAWRWRRTAILDEEKEGKANAAKLQSGEISHADIWEEKGLYADEVFAARRQTWIELQVAAGLLEADGDHADVIAPIDFLLRNELPGEVTYPHLPDGSALPPTPVDPTEPPVDPAEDPADPQAQATQQDLTALGRLTAGAPAALRRLVHRLRTRLTARRTRHAQ